jgi:hypothetical protein
MQKQKLDVMVVMFCYAGNGGVATVLPDIATWLTKVTRRMSDDDRIGRVGIKRAGDIPLTMERNRVVKEAKDRDFDVIVMLDSDNVPDLYLNRRETAKPFWDTSFDLLYERKLKGLPTVVCAPYCGPPPHPVNGGEENVYVFYAESDESDDKDPDKVGAIRFSSYSRQHAALMRGIQPIAAGPTGCIMYSVDAFDLMPIHGMSDQQILEDYKAGKYTTERARQLLRMESWFFYEYTDAYQTRKASTEDVTNTREIQLAGIEKHGEPVVFCNWDAWAGHMKPKCVGAPQPLRIEQVSGVYREAVENNISAADRIVQVDFTEKDDFDPPVTSTTDQYETGLDEAIAKRESNPMSAAMGRQLRLGKPFVSPSISELDCESVRNVMEAVRPDRTAVIGDMTGELCHASRWGSKCSTFAIKVGPEWDKFKSLSGVKLVGKSGEEHQQEDPVEVAQSLPPQELDCVVVHAKEGGDAASVWMERHVRKDGMLVVVDPDGIQPELDLDSNYDDRLLEGTGVRVVFKKVQNVASSL